MCYFTIKYEAIAKMIIEIVKDVHANLFMIWIIQS